MVRKAGFSPSTDGQDSGFRIQKAEIRSQNSKARPGSVFVLLSAFCFLISGFCFSQQPQAQQGQPLSALNAKYVNGVAPGYWPTNGTGLTLNLSAGTSVCGNSQVSYAGGTLTMAASATNYVFLDMTKNCTPAFTSGGSGFPATGIPIAVVATSGSTITGISDARTWFAARPVVDPGGQVYNVKAFGAAGNGTTDDTTAIQAAINAAGNGGNILLPVGNYVVSSQIQVTANYQTIYGYGATIECNLSSANDCLMIGSTSNALLTRGVSVYGLHLAPGPNTSANSGFRDNAQSTHFFDIGGTSVSGSTFYHFLENDNDQAQTVDHLYNMAGIVTCSASSCGSALWGPGGSANAGITWLGNSDLTMGCSGNSIDWSDQNHLTVSRSILQAFSQFALRAMGGAQVDFDGWTHWEQGGCTNPLNDGNGHALGGAALLLVGAGATAEGSAPGGVTGSVFTPSSAGSTLYWYYVVGHTSGGSVTAPLIAGWLANGPSTISSSAKVYAVWPALTASGVTTFDLLRTTGTVPYGTGNYAVVTGLSASTVCGSNGVCAYTDTVTSPSSYTIASESLYPVDTFWPGEIVLFSGSTSNIWGVSTYNGVANTGQMVVDANPTPGYGGYHPHVMYSNGGWRNFQGNQLPAGPGTVLSPGAWDSSSGIPPALVLPKYAGYGSANMARKGAINFGVLNDQSGPTDLLTFFDSNPLKTAADLDNRPSYDANDSALCEDNSSGTGLCIRAYSSFSTYIAHVPDGSSYAERLTSTQKIINVPLVLGGGTAITTMNLYSTASITPTAVSATSCSDQTFSVTGLTTADRVSGITPPSALGNVSVDGYASAAGTVLLHFCNPSSSSVTPPAGVYSFLAVH